MEFHIHVTSLTAECMYTKRRRNTSKKVSKHFCLLNFDTQAPNIKSEIHLYIWGNKVGESLNFDKFTPKVDLLQ